MFSCYIYGFVDWGCGSRRAPKWGKDSYESSGQNRNGRYSTARECLPSLCNYRIDFLFFLPWTFDLNSHLLLLPSERPELDRHLPPVLGSKYLCRFHFSDLTCFATIFCSVLNTFCSDSYRREWRTCWGLWEWSKTFSTQIQNRLSGLWVESEEIHIIKKKTHLSTMWKWQDFNEPKI